MSLFTFHNEFDDVDVTLNDLCPNIPQDGTGPYEVSVIFNAPEISTDNVCEKFDRLADAYIRFIELVKNEIQAVLDDGSLQ